MPEHYSDEETRLILARAIDLDTRSKGTLRDVSIAPQRYLVLAVALAISACATTRPANTTPAGTTAPASTSTAPAPAGALPVPPDKVLSYSRTATENLGPEGGMLHRYRNTTNENVTVFVYSVPSDVKTGSSEPRIWTTREGEKFQQVLPLLVRQGAIQNFSLAYARPDSIPTVTGPIHAHTTAAATRAGNVARVDMLYIYYVNGVFLKVRATLPNNGLDDKRLPRICQRDGKAVGPVAIVLR